MPKDWTKALAAGLRGKGRMVIMGVGNPLKGDDAAGLLCAEALLKSIPAKERRGVKILRAYDVPENYTGIIRKFKPARVIIIDAALAGLKPGDIFVLEKEKIAIEEISSHKIPLMVLISYLEQSIECKVTVLGIQARDLSFGAPVTPGHQDSGQDGVGFPGGEHKQEQARDADSIRAARSSISFPSEMSVGGVPALACSLRLQPVASGFSPSSL